MSAINLMAGNLTSMNVRGGKIVELWYSEVPQSEERGAMQKSGLTSVAPYKMGDPHGSIMSTGNNNNLPANYICNPESYRFCFTYLSEMRTEIVGASDESGKGRVVTTCTFDIVPPPKIEIATGMSSSQRNTTMDGEAVIVEYTPSGGTKVTRLVDYNAFIPSATITCSTYFSARCTDPYDVLAQEIIGRASTEAKVFRKLRGTSANPATIMLTNSFTEQIDTYLFRRVITLILNQDGWHQVGVYRSQSGQILASPDDISTAKVTALGYTGAGSTTIYSANGVVAFAPYMTTSDDTLLNYYQTANAYFKLMKEY